MNLRLELVVAFPIYFINGLLDINFDDGRNKQLDLVSELDFVFEFSPLSKSPFRASSDVAKF
jgi:hypothetical protein